LYSGVIVESISFIEYPLRNSGVATASIPNGAVASELANDGKKNTTFLDIALVSSTRMKRYAGRPRSFVTALSLACHFFFHRDFTASFRVTVIHIVTLTLAFNPITLPLRAEFPLAGARCLLSTNSRELFRLALPWQSLRSATHARSFLMQIIEDTSSFSIPHALSHFRGLRHLVFAVMEPGGFLSFDLLRRRVMGILSPAAATDPGFWNSRLLPISIGVLGTTLGLAPLHCACLDRHGAGLLVAGNSGAGKSTLTAALAERGFAVVSDDWTYASTFHGTLVAHGLFAPVKLLPDAVRFFPVLCDSTICKSLNGEFAYEVDPSKLFHSQWKASSVPKWLLFLERTSMPGCRFIPCPPSQVPRFFEQNAEKLPAELPEAARTRSAIIQRLSSCKSWILRTGDDPIRTAAAIDAFLLEV